MASGAAGRPCATRSRRRPRWRRPREDGADRRASPSAPNPKGEGEDQRRSAEGADQAVLHDREPALRGCASAEAVRRVGPAILMEGAGHQRHRRDREGGGEPGAERERQRGGEDERRTQPDDGAGERHDPASSCGNRAVDAGPPPTGAPGRAGENRTGGAAGSSQRRLRGGIGEPSSLFVTSAQHAFTPWARTAL